MKDYARALLTAIASFFLAIIVLAAIVFYPAISNQHATGLAALTGGLLESMFLPWFWILFLVFFSGFYFAGNSTKRWVRLALFWIPSVIVSLLGLALWAGVFYLATHAHVG